MKRKLQKLRNASFDELRVRGSQAAAAFWERRGWSRRTRLISDTELLSLLKISSPKALTSEGLLEHFCGRPEPVFFSSFADPEKTTADFKRRWPKSVDDVISRASRISKGSFDLLGFRNLEFGVPPDWHFEPVAKKRSTLLHWSRMDYLDADRFGDKKIIWELSRHQYFSTLGQAYWLTGDEQYAKTFTTHILDWIEKNPPKLGINWASSLEVGFRTISWIWALYFFKGSPSLDPSVFMRIVKALYLNALHLQTFLSTYFSPNTHLTGEALGLFYVGTFFPEFKEASRWRVTGLKILTEQLNRHVQDDGVYFEQSSYYHRYTTDFYLHLKILLEQNGEAIPQHLDEKLQGLLDHLMYITRPDGTTPLFGDDDGGRLMVLDDRAANDFRATLSTGAAVFSRGDYKYVAGEIAEETLWLVGPKGLIELDKVSTQLPESQSVAFEKSGYYVMRDGWTGNENYLLFDCGHHGSDNCGHAHADALSFELAAKGYQFLVDPGTYTYTASKEIRDWFRGSQGHNTLTINDGSSSVPSGPFAWDQIANCKRTCWISHERFDYVAASHDGYMKPPIRATHERSIFFLKKNYWVLRDRVDSMWKYRIGVHFHCDSTVEPLRGTNHAIRLLGETGGSSLELASFARSGKWVQESGWVSHCYGRKEEAPIFSYVMEADGSEELITFLLPEIRGAARPAVHEIESVSGRAFEINRGNTHDVLLLSDCSGEGRGMVVETARFGSDFCCAWVRFANERAPNPEEFVLIDGQTLELDGRVLLSSTERIEYLIAKRVGDRYSVETKDRVVDVSLPVENLEFLLLNLSEWRMGC